ncbi:hypothetical protein ACMBCN_03275, partial [Candidatus Liberibacter asiaticus]
MIRVQILELNKESQSKESSNKEEEEEFIIEEFDNLLTETSKRKNVQEDTELDEMQLFNGQSHQS